MTAASTGLCELLLSKRESVVFSVEGRTFLAWWFFALLLGLLQLLPFLVLFPLVFITRRRLYSNTLDTDFTPFDVLCFLLLSKHS